MWNEYGIYIALGFAVIGLLLSKDAVADFMYVISKHWQVTTFIVICGLLGGIVAVKQQEFKYELAYLYYTGTKNTGTLEAKYQIRQCKEFLQAKINGTQANDHRSITAGIFKISSISNWEFCARTFGLNYWKHDLSINGQDGGRVLCDTYARDTYRSSKVQTWCDTVFAPTKTQKIDQKV